MTLEARLAALAFPAAAAGLDTIDLSCLGSVSTIRALASSATRAYWRVPVGVIRLVMASGVAFHKEYHHGLGAKSCSSSAVSDGAACASRRFERQCPPAPRAGIRHCGRPGDAGV